MRLVLGLTLVLAAVGLFPTPRVDPRRALWQESRAGRREDSTPATEAAVTAHLLAIALRTGLPLPTALERVAAESPRVIARDLLLVTTAYDRHGDPEQAWASAPMLWQPVAAALTVAGHAGIAPGPLLFTASGAILRRESAAQEVAIGRVSVRLVLPLGLVLLPAFMCTTVVPLVLVMTRDYLAW